MTSKSIVNDLPPEMLSRIFLQLPYTALLKVQRVCKRWNAIVGEDPALAVQLFKKKSSEYVDAGDGQSASWPLKKTIAESSQEVRIHPAAQIVWYSGAMELEDIRISPKTEPNWLDTWPRLVDLSIANDFIAIPSVTAVHVVHVKSELSRISR